MSNENKQEVKQPNSCSVSSSAEESAPPTDNTRDCDDNVVAESRAENNYNESVESDQNNYNANPLPSPGPPLQLEELEDSSEDDTPDLDHKISQIRGLDGLVVNSSQWYDRVKIHLTHFEREELWDRTPWEIKMYWDDVDYDDENEDDEADLVDLTNHAELDDFDDPDDPDN